MAVRLRLKDDALDKRTRHRLVKAETTHRIESNQRAAEDHSERQFRFRGGASEDISLANICRELGIDYFSIPKDRVFVIIPERCEGRRVDGFSIRAMKFLEQTYDLEKKTGPSGHPVIHFTIGDANAMSLITKIAERTELPRKQVKTFYDALIRQVHRDLRDERKARLPELGLIQVKFREARKAGKKPNPFDKGKMMEVKARPASNKVKFRVSKDLVQYVEDKVEVKKR